MRARADQVALKASPDDRCVAYSSDAGKSWRYVRFLGEAGPIHFAHPVVTTRDGDANPCAAAPPLDAHFQALLGAEGILSKEETESVLTFLAAFPKSTEHHLAWARFVTAEKRRQPYHDALEKRWRAVADLALLH